MESLLTDESSPVWVVRYMSEGETETLINLCTKKLQSGGESISGSAAEEDGDQSFKHSYRALLLRATAYVKQNKFHLALADYNEMLRYNPENADLLYNRGVAYEKVGRIDDAIVEFTKVLQIEPDHVNATYSRAACQNLRGEFENAIDDYMRALQLEQKQAPVNGIYTPTSSVRRQRSSKDLREDEREMDRDTEEIKTKATLVAEETSRIVETNGGLPPGDLNVSGEGAQDGLQVPEREERPVFSSSKATPATVKVKLSLDTDVIASSSSPGIEPVATSPTLHSKGGPPTADTNGTLTPTQKNREVGEETSAPIDENGLGTPDKWYSRGLKSRRTENYRAAIQEYTQAILLDPGHFRAYFDRAFSFDKLGHTEKAVEDYSSAIQINTTNANSYYNRGIAYDKMQVYDKAVDDFTSAIGLDPTNADFYHNRGFSCRKQGKYNLALEDYMEAIKRNPKHSRAYYNRAFVLERLGNFRGHQGLYHSA